MIRKFLLLIVGSFLLMAASQQPPSGQFRIVTTTTTLANMVEYLTQGEAAVYAVASPKRNLHYIEPSPKDVLMVKKADLFIYHGMQAEPWMGPLLQASGNSKILGDSYYSVDASVGIRPLEVPDEVSRSEGDIHIDGNPHYWTDPENAKIMIKNISEALARAQPEKAVQYRTRADDFIRKLDGKLKEWQKRMAPLQGAGIVTYHRSWSYFAKRFDLRLVGEIEPHPGIPPTSKHLAYLLEQIKTQKAFFIVKESYFERSTPERLAQKAGAVLLELIQFPGEVREVEDYFSMMDYNIRQFEKGSEKNS